MSKADIKGSFAGVEGEAPVSYSSGGANLFGGPALGERPGVTGSNIFGVVTFGEIGSNLGDLGIELPGDFTSSAATNEILSSGTLG